MNPHLKYKNAVAVSWTRIDMLLLIYEKAVQALQEGVRQISQQNFAELPETRLAAHRALLMIAEGLNLQDGEVPAQVMRLCLFALEKSSGSSKQDWQAAAEIIQTLREGFLEIQDDARTAEYSGRIPALDYSGN